MRVLTIDVGTTRTKAAVYDDGLSCLKITSRFTDAVSADGSVDLDRFLAGAMETARGVLSAMRGPVVDTVAVSSILGWVFLNNEGMPLGPGRAWNDRRAAEEAEEIGNAFRSVDLNPDRPVTSELLAPQLLYLKRREPAIYERVSAVVGLKDWIIRALTGQWITDYSHEDYSLLAEAVPGLPSDEWADFLPSAVPAWHPVGRVTRDGAGLTSIPEGTPVVAGSSDGTAAMYGAGILAGSVLTAVAGTTDVVMREVRTGKVDSARRDSSPAGAAGLSVNRSIVPGSHLVGGSTGGSGSTLTWWRGIAPPANTAPTDSETEGWEAVSPGAEGLLVAPAFSGERAPFPGVPAGGAVTGLTIRHSAAHIERAILEANTYRLTLLTEYVASAGSSRDDGIAEARVPEDILLGGGSAADGALNEVRAVLFPLPLRIVGDAELSLVGSAMYAITGLHAARFEPGAKDMEAERRLRELAGVVRRRAGPITADANLRNAYRAPFLRWRTWISRYYKECI